MLLRQTFVPKIHLPPGFVLLVDTREQLPLFPPSSWCIHSPLRQGDYSILHFEDVVAIERKTPSDLLLSFGKERKRFEKEISRLLSYEWKGLLVECSESTLYTPSKFSSLHFGSLYQSLASLEVKGFHIYYADTREKARWWVLSRLVRFYKHKRTK